MRQKIEMAVLMVTLMVAGPSRQVLAQPPTFSLEDQLKAQFTLVKMGTDAGGAAVVEQGSILVIRKGGILSVPYAETGAVSTRYQDGVVHSPNSLTKGSGFGAGKKTQATRPMQVGEKVYPSRIAVNLPKDQVTMSIIACDSCNNVSPTTFYKADVIFQFDKGSLANTSASQVEDTIAELLAFDDNVDPGGGIKGDNGGDQQGSQGGANQGGGQAQPPASPTEPVQIEKGQTPEQVRAALGQPEKIVNLGAKQIYVYKDLKITFINGKVFDVQ